MESGVGAEEEGVFNVRAHLTPSPLLYRPFPHDFFCRLWHLVTDALPPQDSAALAEDLGIELDTSEHQVLERSALFTACNAKTGTLKRKREP
jgi:hypothetical protein